MWIAISILMFSLVVVVTGSESVLKGRKVQSALGRILPVFFCVGFLSMLSCLWLGYGFVLGFALLWGGFFLCWFGIRSHLESSILLRMLLLLRSVPLADFQITEQYMKEYGPAARVRELVTGGLVEPVENGMRVTSRGRAVLKVAGLLEGRN